MTLFDAQRKIQLQIKLENIVSVKSDIYKHPLVLDNSLPCVEIAYHSKKVIFSGTEVPETTGIQNQCGGF